MTRDPLDAVGATAREAETREHHGRTARVVTVTRTYPSGPADVWSAMTTAERIPRWFLPVTGDLEVGGHYQLEGNAGGVVESCDPPHSFSVTWEFGGDVSWVEVARAPAYGGTELVLRHVAHVDDERWAEFGPGAVGVGWDLGLRGLLLHLESGGPVDPAGFAAWTVSEDGRAYVTGASEAWGDASVAAGEDGAAARSAAARTTAFYTGT
ncbi:SRPBCC family protein [soil metagenome]